MTWRDPGAFKRDHSQHLVGCGLFVSLAEVGAVREIVQVLLALPSGDTISCAGEVVAPMPSGTGLALQLTSAQRAMLSRSASGRL